MNAGKKPEWLIAPYFYMTEHNYNSWYELNKELMIKSLELKSEYDLDIYAQIVIDKKLLLNGNRMTEILNSFSGADGLIYWIDDFDETSASMEELKAIYQFIKD